MLHSPLRTLPQTLVAWRTLISLQDSGVVRKIGVSNTYDVAVLEALERDGGRRPDVVQDRWFEGTQWDNAVWAYCLKHGIQYQYVPYPCVYYLMGGADGIAPSCTHLRSFWTLSGSPTLLRHSTIRSIASAKRCSPAQALFRIAQLHGVTPLCGTTNEQHMDDALGAEKLDLNDVQATVDDVLNIIRG